MSTDISLTSVSYQVGNRQWLLAEPDVKLNLTLDISKFTAGTHFPNGFIPSGTVVGKVTSGGLGAPYASGNSDGSQVAYGITYGDANVVRPDGSSATKVGISVVVFEAIVSAGKLPFQSGSGSIDSAGKTALGQIRFEA